MSIAHNIEVIQNKIYSAANKSDRSSRDITIVCVSKNRITDEIYQVLDAGIGYIGESKVQEAQTKYAALIDYAKDIDISLNFHMIGHLQTNKVDKALDIFDMIQSVDSLRLAQEIDKASGGRGIVTDILVEVNTSGEESKFGIDSEQSIELLRDISKLNNIQVRGLMTMAPLLESSEYARPYFRRLRELRDKVSEIDDQSFRRNIAMDFLSMGMSQDYEIAVEEGANMLRIGTAIFEGESE
jgi:pyridoxal phosphate enzyme (YggS family)